METLLELLPEGTKRFSLVGTQAVGNQKGFEDKEQVVACTPGIDKDESGKVNVTDFGIGYACKKGLKPESPNQDDFFIMQVDQACGRTEFSEEGYHAGGASTMCSTTRL